MDTIIEVKNLKKSYGSVQAVKGIDFAVERGKLFAFLGPNGAGKSTTIDMICTLLKPDKGEVTIDGYLLGRQDDMIRKCIGVVFQDGVLDDRLTVRENLTVRGRFYMSGRTDVREAIMVAAKVAGIEAFIDRPYGKLSGGQKRRADIARALVNTPKILFLDEPTTGLDPQTRKNVWDMIASLQRDMELTVFFSTHYMEEAARADHIIIINNGEIAVRGTPYELRDTYSSDLLKIKPYAAEREALVRFLEDRELKGREKDQVFHIPIKDTRKAIGILSEAEARIESFEVLHGTMDDVFLNIIGREDAYHV